MKVKGTTSVLKPVDNRKTLYIDRAKFFDWYWTSTQYQLFGKEMADRLFDDKRIGKYTDNDLMNDFLTENEWIPVRLIINPKDIENSEEVEHGELILNIEKYNYEFKEVDLWEVLMEEYYKGKEIKGVILI